MGLLVLLVNDGVFGSSGTRSEGSIGVLSNILVGLLGGRGTGALDGLGNVVDGVLGSVKTMSERPNENVGRGCSP
jgi:hypothetical protein